MAVCTKGGSRLSGCKMRCAARQAGFGMTDIDPFWHPSPQGRTMFDVGRVAQQDGEAIAGRIAPVMANLLLAITGACTGLCEARAPGFACICSHTTRRALLYQGLFY